MAQRVERPSDLDNGIITNAHDAARVLRCSKLWPEILLREDARVQEAYTAWRSRMIRAEAAVEAAPEQLDAMAARTFVEDCFIVTDVVRDLGLLSRYRWLPRALWTTFHRQFGVGIDTTLPADLPWAELGRAPKDGPKQHEDLERNLTWLYRATVKRPPDSLTKLQHDFGIASWNTVDKGIKRAQQLLACVNKELPAI